MQQLALKANRPSAAHRYFSGSVITELFPDWLVLLPQATQIYELELAYGEYRSLTEEELVCRSGYFWTVRGRESYHYRICVNTPEQYDPAAKPERKNFFSNNLFAVGYATHGLYPYRGKFHPQMIRGIMNSIGLQPGHLVLDPMAGCGTTCIEANILGMDSIAIELSPFPCLMTRAKTRVLDIDTSVFDEFMPFAGQIHDYFLDQAPLGWNTAAEPRQLSFLKDSGLERMLSSDPGVREFLLLAFLDAVGYSERRKHKTSRDLFPVVLSRYIAAAKAFSRSRKELGLVIGKTTVIEGDATCMPLPAESVDGIIFSPPYSFAIDYVENDRPQLEYLGIDIEGLKRRMVGLKGGTGNNERERVLDRVDQYFTDMRSIMAECARVLKRRSCCVVVIGSNTNQTGGISLEDKIVRFAAEHGMPLFRHITREIEGIRNTMREEHLLFFAKD